MDSVNFSCPSLELPAAGVRNARKSGDDRTRRPAGVHVRRLPGGARVVELWSGSDHFTVTASGDIEAVDQHAVVDLVTGGILRGVRHVRIDAHDVTFIDVAVLRALVHCDRFLARSGGTLTVLGLRAPFDLAWELLDTDRGR